MVLLYLYIYIYVINKVFYITDSFCYIEFHFILFTKQFIIWHI